MAKPLVSVIIPCFNQGQYLQEAVDSVLASTYQNIEIIVVNDGSTEHLGILNSFSDPKIKIINQDNQGLASARNNGIKKAKGEYILPLDADDKIYPTYIEKAVDIIENNSKIGIVYCKAEFFGIKKEEWKLQEYKFPNILWTNSIFCSAVYRKSDWEKVGGYKKEMVFGFEDWELWLSFIELGLSVYRIPEILFSYRQTAESMSNKMMKLNNKNNMIKLLIKFHPKLYADNFEQIIYPLLEIFEYNSCQQNWISKYKYKMFKLMLNFTRKFSSLVKTKA